MEEIQLREEQENERTAALIVWLLNGLGSKKEGGRPWEIRDVYQPGRKKEQTPEDMLAVMKANSQILNMLGKR